MIRIYNSLTRTKEDFKPLVEGKVSMYVCGPTVYDLGHLGHGRSAVAFDIVRRYLEYSGLEVKFVFNNTDIDDKMIKRAAEEGITVKELAQRIMPEYDADYGALGVKPPTVKPLATEHVPEMIEIIVALEKKGFAYVLDDGVYYDVAKFEEYGKLSGQKLEELKMGARVDVKESKRNPYDFVLWKFKKEGEPSWESPWGEGRPGWHIESSAMSRAHLGEGFDIHGGGLDLTFPHHECEIAQTEAALGSGSFARYWMHNGFINVDDEKMSKSLNNFFTLRDIFEKYDPQVVRFMLIQSHYRKPVNFSDSLLDQAKNGLERLHDFVRKLHDTEDSDEIVALIDVARAGFEKSMNDDFDTSGALGAVFELVKEVNKIGNGGTAVLKFLKSVDAVLGICFFEEEEVDDEVNALIKEREEVRAAKDWARSDEIRDELAAKGIVLEDGPDGITWKRA